MQDVLIEADSNLLLKERHFKTVVPEEKGFTQSVSLDRKKIKGTLYYAK